MKDAISFTHGASLGHNYKLSGRHVGETSVDVSNESNRMIPIAEMKVTLSILHCVVAMGCLRMNILAIRLFDSVVLKVLFICSSASYNSEVVLSDQEKIALICQRELDRAVSSIFLARHTCQLFYLSTILSEPV